MAPRAMACINPWPRIGLSTARIVCRLGASNPISHMSRTSTARSGSPGPRNRFSSASRLALFRMWVDAEWQTRLVGRAPWEAACGPPVRRAGGGAPHVLPLACLCRLLPRAAACCRPSA